MARWLLPIWFGLFGIEHLLELWAVPPAFGFDVRLYQLAARAWLAGGDPWSIYVLMPEAGAVHFAGPPPTLLPFAMLAWFPFDYISPVVVLSLAAVATWVLHRLSLPTYWLLFPPILDAIWFGNINIFVVALLILGGSAAAACATILKVYAVVPLIVSGRYRLAVTSILVFLATLPFLPWGRFLSQFGAISATLGEQAWGGQSSILTSPLAIAGAVIALILLGRARAAWLAVPLLWPATQLHYSVLALPTLAAVPALALAGSIASPGVLGYATMVMALWERREAVHYLWRRFARTEGLS